ncbi:MAG: hypothetical protein HYZ53_21200 [Planctomycetes bacterium]|nr:hypothetical protein [Planctomycetota bacterium]
MAIINHALITTKDRRKKNERRHNPINVFSGPRLEIATMFSPIYRGLPFDGAFAMGDLMTFAYPLYDETTEFEDFQITLHFAELCWKYSLANNVERNVLMDAIRHKVRATAEQFEALHALMNGMTLRHRELFPSLYAKVSKTPVTAAT